MGLLIKHDDEWSFEIEKDDVLLEYGNYVNRIYVHHHPATNVGRCDRGGKWVHGSTVDVCNCGVKYPSVLYFKLRVMNEARKLALVDI